MPLFYGRGVFQYSFGLMPYLRPVTTVGEPRPGLRVGEGLQSKRWACAARECGHRPVHTSLCGAHFLEY